MAFQLFQHHLLKTLSLVYCIVFAPFSKTSWLYIWGSIYRLYFAPLLYLFFLQYPAQGSFFLEALGEYLFPSLFQLLQAANIALFLSNTAFLWLFFCSHICLWLHPRGLSTFKDLYDETGPTWIIQGMLPLARSLI